MEVLLAWMFGLHLIWYNGGGQDASIITHPNDCDSKTCNCSPQSRAGLCDCEPLTFIAAMLHRATHAVATPGGKSSEGF